MRLAWQSSAVQDHLEGERTRRPGVRASATISGRDRRRLRASPTISRRLVRAGRGHTARLTDLPGTCFAFLYRVKLTLLQSEPAPAVPIAWDRCVRLRSHPERASAFL